MVWFQYTLIFIIEGNETKPSFALTQKEIYLDLSLLLKLAAAVRQVICLQHPITEWYSSSPGTKAVIINNWRIDTRAYSIRFCQYYYKVYQLAKYSTALIFSCGQFWSFGIECGCLRLSVLVFVCMPVSPCVNLELVRAITSFKARSPNLNQRCRSPWLRF